jgi:hypothetical protein
MNDVLGMAPPEPEKKFPFILGLIPCWNRDYLDPAWSVVRPGIEEIAQLALGEFDALFVWQQIFSGQFQLYMGYTDKTGVITPQSRYQMALTEKLRTPDKDFLGFFILDIFRKKSVHVFAAYIMPEYRDKNLWEMGYEYIESQVKMIGAKELSVTMPKATLESMKARGFEEGLLNMRKVL